MMVLEEIGNLCFPNLAIPVFVVKSPVVRNLTMLKGACLFFSNRLFLAQLTLGIWNNKIVHITFPLSAPAPTWTID